MQNGKALRLTFSVSMILGGGFILSYFFYLRATIVGDILINFGSAFLITGVVSLFRDIALLKFENEELTSELSKIIGKHYADKSGIRQIQAEKRRGWDGYYKWTIPITKQKLFFSGRSVLHRIDEDLTRRSLSSAAKIILRKLKEGSDFTILFLDPRTDLLGRLIKEEDNPDMLKEIATSLGICKDLFELLVGETKTNKKARFGNLSICIYDEVPYFAYHRVDDFVCVGFYFSGSKGYNSGVHEIIDDENKKTFEDHFNIIHYKSKTSFILEIKETHNVPHFNSKLYHDLRNFIALSLGDSKTNEYMNLKSSDWNYR